jgi:hypothetical protein
MAPEGVSLGGLWRRQRFVRTRNVNVFLRHSQQCQLTRGNRRDRRMRGNASLPIVRSGTRPSRLSSTGTT